MKIPYSRQSIFDDDVDAVVSCLRSDFLTQGPLVNQFEAKLAHIVGARFGVAVNSATSALHLACLSVGVKSGDIVWTSPISFVASANCAVYCGAKVDFVDIDSESFNICPDLLAEKLENAAKVRQLPKALIVVHMCGQSADMKRIYDVAAPYGIRIIEDASHAVGAKFLHHYVGACKYSDITVFSFHPVKIITTGEGGMALTNDESLADSMRRCRSHGITRDFDELEGEPHGGWYYQQLSLGYNYRLTDIQAALGISQLKKLNDQVAKRNNLALRYEKKLERLPIKTPQVFQGAYSSWHLYVIRLESDEHVARKGEIFDHLRQAGIGVNVHYIPIHIQPFYSQMGFNANQFPRAMDYYRRAISIPLFAELTFNDQEFVVEKLSECLQA